MEWFGTWRDTALNIARLYTLLYVPLLALTGFLIYIGKELAGKQLVAVDVVLATGFFVAAILKLVAAICDIDEVYQVAYVVATIVMGWWVFTSIVYAYYGVGSWGRALAFGFIMAQNGITLPYLLQVRRVNAALKATAGIVAEGMERRNNEHS